jgi:A/G-specific adenine glycosylase
MLQQTQVATVVPYFERFVARFPTVEALALADEIDVLRHWEGLGYYRRARQLHEAARIVFKRHAGQLPRGLEALGQLPGIGRYTAGAIVSIAFDARAPILEANTVRLLSRLIAFDGDVSSGAGREELWRLAEAILPRRNCGAFNSALMEVGSQICTPRLPRCDRCPLGDLCTSFRRGVQHQVPRARAKPASEAVREAAVVVIRDGRVLLGRRGAGERWAGLWDFPRFQLAACRGVKLHREIIEKVQAQSGLSIEPPQWFITLKHGVTRFRITLECYRAACPGRRTPTPTGQWRWVKPGELANFPLSVTGRKLSRLLTTESG